MNDRRTPDFHPTVLPLKAAPEPPGRADRTLWLAIAFTVLTGLVVGAALWHLRGGAIASGERLAGALSQVIAEQTTRTVQTVEQRLQFAAHQLTDLRAEQGVDEAGGRQFLRAQLAGLPFVRAMWVLDAQGRIELDSDVGNIGLSLADREYFQLHRRDPGAGFFIGPLVRSRSTGGWLISASLPLLDAQGQFAGAIVAAVEPPHFEALWRQIEVGDQGAIALFHRGGQLMMRSPPDPQAIGANFSNLPLFREMLPGAAEGRFVGASAVDDVQRVIAYRVLPQYPQLLVAVGISLDHLLGPWRRFGWLTVGLWLLAVAGATLLGRQLQRQLGRRQHLEQRFRELAQAMPQIVFITDRNGTVEFVNERWSEATGLPTEYAVGARWDQLAHPDDAEPSREQLAQRLAAGEPVQLELRLRHPSGEDRWQLVRAVPNRDDAGEVVSWFGTSTDVHELKLAQQRLQQQADEIRQFNATLEQRIAQRTRELATQEALFRTLAEEAPVPIWTVDPNGAATFFSRAWYQLVGGAPPQWLGPGHEWLQLVHPEDRPGMSANWRRCLRTGEVFEGTRRLRASDGTWHTTNYRACPVRSEDGRIAFWVGIDSDITHLIANEEALRLANEQLRAFSYSVSHDLQSPLQRIGSFAQLLQQDPALGSAGARSAHYLQRIVANVDEMVQMVQGLLGLSRVTEAPMVRREIDLSGMAAQLMEQLQADAPQRRVRWEVAPGLAVIGDTGLMRSVMENLLANAWKFTSRTEDPVIVVGRTVGGEFFVRDNGAGFEMEHAERLFGTFERLHRQDEFPGTGIGLATVARAISRQGGRVRAVGAPGQGATFYFTLPAPG